MACLRPQRPKLKRIPNQILSIYDVRNLNRLEYIIIFYQSINQLLAQEAPVLGLHSDETH